MPFPLLHGCAGAAAALVVCPSQSPRARQICTAAAILAISPDFDFAFRALPWVWIRHHGLTHSFAYAFAAPLLLWPILKRLQTREYLALALATLTHSILDFFVTESRGLDLLWPFYEHRYKLGLHDFFGYRLYRHNLDRPTAWTIILGQEFALGLAAMVVALLIRRWMQRRVQLHLEVTTEVDSRD